MPNTAPIYPDINIRFSTVDDQYVATTPAYSSISHLDDTVYDALVGLVDLIVEIEKDLTVHEIHERRMEAQGYTKVYFGKDEHHWYWQGKG